MKLTLHHWLLTSALISPFSAAADAAASTRLRGGTTAALDAASSSSHGHRNLLQCEGSDPLDCGCDSVRQADYRGAVSTTDSGAYTCQVWDSQSPHSHSRIHSNYPDKGLEGGHNYCRNPDGEPGGVWCYTTDPDTRWRYCDVPSCVVPGLPPPTNVPTVPELTNPPTTPPTNTPSNPPTPVDSLSVCSTPELTSLEELTSNRRMAFQNSGLTTIIGGTSTTSQSPSCKTELTKQKVLLIGIDGLRADVVGMTPLPAIRRLQAMGTYSFWANVQSTASAVSGPGWASMFTGVQPSKHLVEGNSDLTDISSPTVFKLVKDAFGMKIAASVTWSPLVTQIIDHEDASTLDGRYTASNDDNMAQKAEEWILSEQFDFVFVAFDGADSAGHSTGFDGYASVYQNRVREVDTLVGNLLDAVLSTSSGEEWLIVLTTDHGGEGKSHGPDDLYNRKIPFMVASNSPRVGIGYMPYQDPGSQMDVLPTIMHFLGGAGAIPDGLDGQVFGFNDYPRRPPSPPGECNPDPENCGCASTKQADYRGIISVTSTGLTCQPWADQTPHAHSRTPEKYPDSGLDSNFCRNPDGESGAWCYTADEHERWQRCSVPICDTTTPTVI